MSRNRIVSFIGVFVFVSGIIGIGAWVFDIPSLKSISPEYVTLKFSSALSFALSGAVLYLLAKAARGGKLLAQAFLPALVLVILLIMTSLLASVFLGVRTGVEELFIREGPSAVKTVVPGRPSIMTMIDFVSIAIAGVFAMFEYSRLGAVFMATGLVNAASGAAAIVGYALNIPELYYYFDGFTPMSLNAAVLFIIEGAGFCLLAWEYKTCR